MLELVRKLKREGFWIVFENFLKKERENVIKELIAMAPAITEKSVIEANTKVKLFGDFLNLENWSERLEREGVK